MKVLFVSINKLKSYRPVLPIGMVMVATQLKASGHQVRCTDLMFETDDEEVIQRQVAEFQPDMVGISIRNVDSLNLLEPAIYTPLALEVADWARSIRPEIKILLGGAGFTTVPEDLMDFVGADYGLLGFAEQTMPELLHCLEQGREPREVDGIIFPGEDGYYKKPPLYSIDYARVLPPEQALYDPRYFEYSFETHDEMANIPIAVQTKKGCVLECVFCSNFLIDGPRVIARGAKEVADQVESAIAEGAKSFEIVDGVFNLPLGNALNILREFERRGFHVPWTCMINPGTATPELVELMVKTGCREVQLGDDSCCDRVLAGLKKNFRKKHIQQVHSRFADAGIRIMHCLFIGSPGDDRESVLETLDAMEEIAPASAANSRVYWTFGLRVSRGTELHHIALREGLLRGDERFLIPKYYVSPPVLQDEDLLEEIQERVLQNDNWYLWWGLNSISLRQRLEMSKRENLLLESIVLQAIEQRRPRFAAKGDVQ